MAYAALALVAQTTNQILNDEQYSISVEEKQQIKSIHEYTIQLQAFLEDSPERLRSLEGRIRDVANEAEDIIECLVLNQMTPSSSGLTPPFSFECYEGVKYADHLNLFDLTKAIEDIDLRQLGYSPVVSSSSSKSAPAHEDVIIDVLDDDLMAVKNRLCGGSSRLQLLPIFGVGGIGKTTLARIAYHDPFVKEYFLIRAWVVHYGGDGIPCDPLLIEEESNAERSCYLLSQLYERSKGRRYLIVMDDVRSTEVWDAVRDMFPDDNNGSRIMLTTRFSDVAAYPDIRSFINEMHWLNEDQSWNLLRHKALADQDCPLELEHIGKEIARGCRGYPLAISMSARLLSSVSKNPALWGEITKNINSFVATKGGQFEEMLSLNYTHLPNHTRSCLSSMRAFTRYHRVPISKLTKSWMAMIENLMLLLNHPHRAQLGVLIHDLENTIEKIESIAEQVMPINNSFRIKEEQQLCDSLEATSSSSKLAPTHNDVMIGFDNDLMEIKHLLCGESSKLQVIPIFGMGGIGKTTLAKKAYDDPLIMESFHVRAWVTISQYYSVQEILSTLLVSLEGFIANISGQSNDEKVYKSLKGRKYLIVVDDMWSTDAWDDLKMLFPDDGNGSRIMLTTRLLDVASYPNLCSSTYEMHFMNENQSWDLLHQKVFPQQDCPSELENIGKEIAKCCGGLPLAIVVVAGLLSAKGENPALWKEIAVNINSVVAGKDGQFEEILSLSYTHLPHFLRPCFLYLAGFPEDHEIRVSKLIKLWAADGFLKHPNGSKSLEKVAKECLENLVNRSLVLVTKRKSNGKIKSCSLHDLMRDLCIRKASEEKFLANIRDQYVAEGLLNQRRISISFRGPPYNLLVTDGSTIHTLMWFLYTSLPSLESYRLLRVLDAGDAIVQSLPANLFELFHLRYLAINYPWRIPEGISQLQNLQTLIIRARGHWKDEARYADYLPQEMWSMPQLRHLFFYGTLPDTEGTTSPLEKLQTLVFSLSSLSTKETLKMIPNLKKLKLNCYDRQGHIFLNYLVWLHLLESLEIRSHSTFTIWRKGDFSFPWMLKKLTLSGLRLSWNEMAAVCSLPNLEVLKLKDYACRGSTWETTEGEFPKLEYLLIEKSYLERWTAESYHFPRLKFLLIHDCCRLSEIPDGIGETTTLELIEIKGHVKKSLVESANRIQDEQQDLGNDDLQVRCMTQWTALSN